MIALDHPATVVVETIAAALGARRRQDPNASSAAWGETKPWVLVACFDFDDPARWSVVVCFGNARISLRWAILDDPPIAVLSPLGDEPLGEWRPDELAREGFTAADRATDGILTFGLTSQGYGETARLFTLGREPDGA